jgi:hypothetical protein
VGGRDPAAPGRIVAESSAPRRYDLLWHDVQAFRGEVVFSSPLGVLQLERVTRRHGFECIARGFSSGRPLRDLGNCIYAYGLARAFNPGAASRQRFFRRYDELSISQHTLRTLYGGPNPSRTARARGVGRLNKEEAAPEAITLLKIEISRSDQAHCSGAGGASGPQYCARRPWQQRPESPERLDFLPLWEP